MQMYVQADLRHEEEHCFIAANCIKSEDVVAGP